MHANWLTNLFRSDLRINRTEAVAKLIKEKLVEWKLKTDNVTLVGTGISGVIVVTSVANILGSPIAIVRKEHSHSFFPIESTDDIGHYIILDDFIESGSTVRRIVEIIKARYSNSECLAFFGFDTLKSRHDLGPERASVKKVCPEVYYAS